jgi:hypothetical protein
MERGKKKLKIVMFRLLKFFQVFHCTFLIGKIIYQINISQIERFLTISKTGYGPSEGCVDMEKEKHLQLEHIITLKYMIQ